MRLFVLLALAPSFALAQVANTGTPSIGSSGGGSGGSGGATGTIVATRFSCVPTTASVTATTAVIPSTTCLASITSDGPYTLASPGGVAVGVTDGQQMRIRNASANDITIGTGAANVLLAKAVLLTAQGGFVDLAWVAVPGAWILDTSNTLNNLNGTLSVSSGGTGSATQNFVDLTTAQASIGGAKTFTAAMALTAALPQLTLGVASSIAGGFVLKNASNANTTTIQSGVAGSSITLTLPTTVGTANQFLKTDGANPATLTWATAATTGSLAAIWSPTATAALADATSFASPLKLTTFVGKVRNITCSWLTAGVVSGGVDVINMKVRDTTASSDLCNCTFTGAVCNVTVGTVESCDCNSGAMTATDAYALQFSSSTNCAANPAAVSCSVELVDP